jgi:antitoxin component YwqK of YwqJK toxin-antitoxin module
MNFPYENEDYNLNERETVNTSYYKKKGLHSLPEDILNKIINVSNYEDSRSINYLDRDFNSRYPKSYLQSKSRVIEPHGTIRTYYDTQKKSLHEIIQYRNGVKQGLYLEYYKSNLGDTRINIRIEANYNKDKLENKWRFYYKDGSINIIRNFKNGKINGRHEEYDENGKISVDANYKNNLLDGKIIHYYENGNINTIHSYVNGKLHGEKVEYYEDGDIKVIYQYKDDMLCGLQRRFNKRFSKL